MSQVSVISPLSREPIAIVGMSCRFPGVSNVGAFWSVLRNGIDTLNDYADQRTPKFDSVFSQGERIATRRGGFLEGVDQFDAGFFGISPREAALMDPQQRVLLELTWDAFEDAGIRRDEAKGSRTGVFVGLWTADYESIALAASADPELYTTTGTGRYAASGRLAYAFDLRGPTLTLDTGCSSSLVAVHLACQSLWFGDSHMAIAAAANLILEPHHSIAYSASTMLAADGKCKFADESADGYVRSEGAGVVILKPLSRAVADGDPIHAVIRGTAVNNDGASSGSLVAPSRAGQEALLREALASANIGADALDYIEAHGTGTRVGDVVEVEAIGRVLAESKTRNRPCYIGSVKTNIGHTEAAAGIAGLIKTSLALKNNLIPASLNVSTLNPRIAWDELPIHVPQMRAPWPADTDGIAGVSSFGITGTNAHVILQRHTMQLEAPRVTGPVLIPVSAHTPGALAGLLNNWLDKTKADETWPANFADVAYTAAVRRTHHAHRCALVVRDREDLLDQLQAAAELPPEKVRSGSRIVLFVYSGQGSQWVGMGRELMQQDQAFRERLQEIDSVVREVAGWSVIDALQEGSESLVKDVAVIQVVLFALQVALTDFWVRCGVKPAGVLGHSMGEVAAALIVGALTLREAVTVIHHRSRLLGELSGKGAMALIGLPANATERRVQGRHVCIAGFNSPASTVISGEPSAVAEIVAEIAAEGAFCRSIQVDVASHSRQTEAMRPELEQAVEGINPAAGSTVFYSTVTGTRLASDQLGPRYWGRNLREPVRFMQALEASLRDGFDTIIEVSPHPLLTHSIQEVSAAASVDVVVASSTRRNEPEYEQLLRALAGVYAAGVDLNWKHVSPVAKCVALPPYSWDRERFWVDTSLAPTQAIQVWTSRELSTPIELATVPRTYVWIARRSNVDHNTATQLLTEAAVTLDKNSSIEVQDFHAAKSAGTEHEAVQVVFVQKEEGVHAATVATRSGVEPWSVRVEATVRMVRNKTSLLHEIAWIPYAVESEAVQANRTWYLLGSNPRLLNTLLSQRGQRVEARHESAESFDLKLTEGCHAVVVYSVPPNLDALDVEAISAEYMRFVEVARRLSASGGNIRFWLVTTEAQRVATEKGINPGHSAAWGMMSAIDAELPELRCSIVDLDKAASETGLAMLADLLASDPSETMCVLRGSSVQVARLQSKSAPKAPATLNANATYLVTGGSGGLGLVCVRAMAGMGARHFVLIGRSEPPVRLPDEIAALESMGADVRVLRCDVTNAEQVRKLVSNINATMPPLKGILHTAAVLDDATFGNVTNEAMARVIAPKAAGAWNLHAETLAASLDFFVCFSSLATIVGNFGQASYATANAFLDGFAAYRRSQGFCGVSVRWGAFDAVGLTAHGGGLSTSVVYEARGFRRLKPEDGIEALQAILQDQKDVTVIAPDWQKFTEAFPQQSVPPLFRQITAHTAPKQNRMCLRDELLNTPIGSKRTTVIQASLKQQLASVLRTSSHRIGNDTQFGSMGLDSLMHVEYARRLSNTLEFTVQAPVLYNYSTISTLAQHLADKMGVPLAELVHVPERSQAAAVGASILVTDLSDEQAIEELLGSGGWG